MKNIELLVTSVEYIEKHLQDDIKTDDVAAACYCSKSTLEKLFRCVNHITVHDYMLRRRMTLAAKQLANKPEKSILDVALEYGYSTHESFARAFEQIRNCKPSVTDCTKQSKTAKNSLNTKYTRSLFADMMRVFAIEKHLGFCS